jgi:hypothetical protein
MSCAATLVVHPARLAPCAAVPEAIAGVADAVIEFAASGTDVPLGTFHTSTVAVPASTVMSHDAIVHANGTPYDRVAPALNAAPPPSNTYPIPRTRMLAVTEPLPPC